VRRAVWTLALVALVGLGAGLAVRATGVRLVLVTTGSMTPTVGVGAWIVVSDADTAEHGDIIEFRYPSGSAGRAIKRVIAVGGDVVELTGATLIVNGKGTPLAGEPMEFERTTITIPPGFVYLLGDDHASSYDSRGFGPIPPTDIVGRVRTAIPNPAGLALGLGALAAMILLAPLAIRRLRT
jgi:signal peptidase I